MAGKFSQIKPGASSTVHLFVAALLWTAVGILLMSRGVIWLAGVHRLWIVIPAVLLGSIKALFVLDRSATRIIHRIKKRCDGKCIGGVYSIKTWILVLVMMLSGYLLRTSGLPKEFLGLLYVTIGWGLFLASRNAWVSWAHRMTVSRS